VHNSLFTIIQHLQKYRSSLHCYLKRYLAVCMLHFNRGFWAGRVTKSWNSAQNMPQFTLTINSVFTRRTFYHTDCRFVLHYIWNRSFPLVCMTTRRLKQLTRKTETRLQTRRLRVKLGELATLLRDDICLTLQSHKHWITLAQVVSGVLHTSRVRPTYWNLAFVGSSVFVRQWHVKSLFISGRIKKKVVGDDTEAPKEPQWEIRPSPGNSSTAVHDDDHDDGGSAFEVVLIIAACCTCFKI